LIATVTSAGRKEPFAALGRGVTQLRMADVNNLSRAVNAQCTRDAQISGVAVRARVGRTGIMPSERSKMTSRVDQTKGDKSPGWVRIALALLCVSEGAAVFFGLKDLMPPTGIAASAIPVITAIVVTGVFYLLWEHLCKVVPRARKQPLFGIALGFILMIVTIASSAWFIAAAIGGGAAIKVHQDAYVAEVKTQYDLAVSNLALEKQLQTKVGDVTSGFKLKCDEEPKNGLGPNRVPGSGPRTAVYCRATEGLLEFLATIDAHIAADADMQKQLVEAMTAMRQTRNPVEFNDKATKVSALLTTLASHTKANEVGNYGIIIVDTTIRDIKVQADAATKDMRDTAKAISEKRAKIDAPFWQPLTGAVAIMQYPEASPGAWVVGVAIDMLPFFLLLILFFSAAEERHRDEERDTNVARFPVAAE
jgi:hypothetical protein